MKPVNHLGSPVLELTSRFVLQVLPYLLMAVAAVFLLPRVAGTLIAAARSSPRQIETMIEPFGRGETTRDLIRHEAFAPNRLPREIAKAAEADPEDR